MMQYVKRKQLLTILFCLNLVSLVGQTNSKPPIKDSNKLELTGNIPGLENGETVFLNIWDARARRTVFLDSTVVKNGKFNFEYFIEKGPRLFWIQFSKHPHIVAVPFDNEKVSISYDKNINSIQSQSAFQYLKTDGSKIARQFLYLGYAIFNTWYYSINKMDKTIWNLKDSVMSISNIKYIAGIQSAKELLNHTVGEILLTQPVQEVIPEFFDNLPENFQHENFFVEVYEKLEQRIKESYYGEIMREKIALCNGQAAPDFSFSVSEGKMMSLKEIIQKNKLTLLHFWSNTSKERKQSHHVLNDLYKRYHNLGMEVLSVSLDANPDKWRRVIKEDNIPGYQTCDFKEEEGPIARLYKMDTKNTVNVLIDQGGKIIVSDIDGPALFGYLFQKFGQ